MPVFETTLDGQDVLSERLRYWNPVKAADGARHDGNVSEAEFTHGENGSRTEAYSYDALGRITGTRAYLGSSSVATTGFTEGGISYSRNGDILSLKRYGAAGLSENLGYAYNSSGQLYSVRDTVAGSTKTFQFDSAGNLTSDGYESGKEYMYNVLGKLSSVMAPEPGIFSLDRVETAKYIYLADGTKIGVSLPDGSETMYRGPFILHRDADGDVELQTLILPEGIAVPDQNSLKMYIFVSDRLGSIRAVVDLGEREVCEENDYYAFGSRIPGGEQLIENRWRYSGKEEQEALSDLPYIDFGARLYNPRLGRWLSPDPLAEKYFSMSPYNYCGNDPLNFVDLYGMNPIYSQNGLFLGTDNLGLQGNYIIMDESNFKQGMQNECATEYDLGLAGLNGSDATLSFLISYLGLKDRPDWDGFVTRKEGIKWAKKHPNAIECYKRKFTLHRCFKIGFRQHYYF